MSESWRTLAARGPAHMGRKAREGERPRPGRAWRDIKRGCRGASNSSLRRHTVTARSARCLALPCAGPALGTWRGRRRGAARRLARCAPAVRSFSTVREALPLRRGWSWSPLLFVPAACAQGQAGVNGSAWLRALDSGARRGHGVAPQHSIRGGPVHLYRAGRGGPAVVMTANDALRGPRPGRQRTGVARWRGALGLLQGLAAAGFLSFSSFASRVAGTPPACPQRVLDAPPATPRGRRVSEGS